MNKVETLAAQHRYSLWQTGGGCTAIGLLFDDGRQEILITSENCADAPVEITEHCIAYHYLDGEVVREVGTAPFSALLEQCRNYMNTVNQ